MRNNESNRDISLPWFTQLFSRMLCYIVEKVIDRLVRLLEVKKSHIYSRNK